MEQHTCFFCESNCYDPSRVSECTNASMCYTFKINEPDGVSVTKKGCISTPGLFYCKRNKLQNARKPHSGSYSGICCKGNFCNNQTVYEDESFPLKTDESFPLPFYIIIIVIVLLSVIMILNKKCIAKYFKSIKKCHKRNSFSPYCTSDDFEVSPTKSDGTEICEEFTSGSGSGLPLLIQRTFAKEIILEECLYKGRFNEVYRGKWKEDYVAVKVFYSRDEALWLREKEIYTENMLQHDNILGYLGSDFASNNSCSQLWLITPYHKLGSLYDYLNVHTLNLEQVLSILITAISGLCHLHKELVGVYNRKPGIAHRDIKSKNILMKDDRNVCIADFGLAITHTEQAGELCNRQKRVGTKRYMAPEILDESFDAEKFDSHKMADMYSFALVMWEVCLRCRTDGYADEYSLPYGNVVPSDPSYEDMIKVVCIDGQRPYIPDRFLNDNTLSSICKLFQECWSTKPSTRLTAFRVRKSLDNCGAGMITYV